MLRQRIVTATIVLASFLAALFWLPALAWWLLVSVLCLLAGREWGRLAGLGGAGLAAYALLVGLSPPMLLVDAQGGAAALWLSTAFWLLAAPLLLVSGAPEAAARPAALAAIGWVAIVPAGYALGALQSVPATLIALLAVVWVADSAAYFAGRRFGRHRLAPAISPGKTWEGVAGGLLGVWGYWTLVNLTGVAPDALRGVSGVALATVLALMSIEGDLLESWLKRRAGAKDSGTLLPGHGGILDRIDGLTPTLPAAALAIDWLPR